MMFHSSFSSSTTISATFLCLLAARASIPFVGAAENNVTVDQLYAKIAPTAALPGFNVEGGSREQLLSPLLNSIARTVEATAAASSIATLNGLPI